MAKRIFNFSAGPANLPLPVIEKAQQDLYSYEGSGIGVMELSHRSKAFDTIIQTAEANFRKLLDIKDDYSVLFLPGGGTLQFSMIPMNLLQSGQTADYIVTGYWAEKAYEEARTFGEVNLAASSADKNHCYIPSEFKLSSNSAYVHFTSNNTIFGTQFQREPDVGGRPLVCDASSDLLHKRIDVTKYGLIYAGAQKNLGPAGVTVVIIRNDLLGRSPKNLPVMLNYNTHVKSRSIYNTPPTFPIYIVGEVLKWIIFEGGLDVIEQRNRHKAKLLYSAIDSSKGFYKPHAEPSVRSLMNVCFRISDESLEPKFIKEAAAAGLNELAGHRNLGGVRASIYNACPVEAVTALAGFMKDFAAAHHDS